jgi:Na+/alanine symporter
VVDGGEGAPDQPKIEAIPIDPPSEFADLTADGTLPSATDGGPSFLMHLPGSGHAFVAIACLFLAVATTAACSGAEWKLLELASQAENARVNGRPVRRIEAEVIASRRSVMSFLPVYVFFPAMTAMICWVHRARTNLQFLNTRGLEHSPDVVLYEFAVPYRFMQELWRASAPRETASPFAWRQQRASVLIGAWFAAYLVGMVATLLSRAVGKPRTGNRVFDDLQSLCIADLIANAVALAAWVLSIVVVHRIWERQQAKYRLTESAGLARARTESEGD